MLAWIGRNKLLVCVVVLLIGISLVMRLFQDSDWVQALVDPLRGTVVPLVIECVLLAIVAVIFAFLGWTGFRRLREFHHYRTSRLVDVSHLSPVPPADIQLVIDQLTRLGFKRLGEDRSARPDYREQITAWLLLDPDRATIAEVGATPEPREVICGLMTIFADEAVLMTGNGLGGDHRADALVVQGVALDPEDAWHRHRSELAAMAARHGGARLMRDMGDALDQSPLIRARLLDERHRRERWMLAGWLVGAAIAWGALAVTGIVHLQSGITETAIYAWRSSLSWPVLVALLVVTLPMLWNIRRLIRGS